MDLSRFFNYNTLECEFTLNNGGESYDILEIRKNEVVALDKPLQWAAEQGLAVITIPNSTHFFHGKLIELRNAINRYVPPVLGITSY